MRIVATIALLLFSAVFFQQCKEEEEGYKTILTIPESDRFVYKSGDLLLYSCTCGSNDTVDIKQVRFWTEIGTSMDWFGNEHTYSIDHQSIILEKNDEEWINAVYYSYSLDLDDSLMVPCFLIETSGYDSKGLPETWIANGCDQFGGMVFAESGVVFPIISINDASYQQVYRFVSNRPDTDGIEILWNLKYGVIRFSEYISGYWKHWNLEGRIQK